MPLPTIADTIRVGVEGTNGAGHKWANVLHFRKAAITTYPAAIAVLDPLLLAHYTVASGVNASWKQYAPTTSTLDQFRYTPLDNSSASTIVTHAVIGAIAGEELPDNVALVVSLHTARRGRSYRGRVYTGPYTENSNGPGGAPTANDVLHLAGQWNAFIAALIGSGLTLVVASYLHATAEDVTACTVDGRWDTQRRRLRR